MALLFPRMSFGPQRVGPAHQEFGPLFNLLDETINDLAPHSRRDTTSWVPRFDVRETGEAYTLEGEVPGVDQKDINIEFTDDHTLKISGHHERTTKSGTPPGKVIGEAEQSHKATVEDEKPTESTEVTKSDEGNVSKPKHQFWISERSYGSFQRLFSFPARVEQDAVKASLKNGILEVIVPKAKRAETRRINIQ